MGTSIIILSYNTYKMTRECIESIREFTTPGSYEIIVIDNNSQDKSPAWLKKQQDIKVILNKENMGFPKGCNQGMEIAQEGNDILLLNSDTIVTPNWLDNLQKALYSRENIGAVGCVTNNCSNSQAISVNYTHPREAIEFGREYNKSDSFKWELRPRLIGFCYLIKYKAYKEVGLLDEIFTPGNYEDDDYSFRLIEKGYKLLLCKDTFIHHYGSASFLGMSQEEKLKRMNKLKKLYQRNLQIFKDKWQVSDTYGKVSNVILEVRELPFTEKKVLVLGCGIGIGLYLLQGTFPNLKIYGVEENKREAEIAAKDFAVSWCQDMEREVFSCLHEKYDYILITEKKKEYQDFYSFVEGLGNFLTEDGAIYRYNAE